MRGAAASGRSHSYSCKKVLLLALREAASHDKSKLGVVGAVQYARLIDGVREGINARPFATPRTSTVISVLEMAQVGGQPSPLDLPS